MGAGAVGVEFASVFARFGSAVTVVEMLPRVLPLEDEEISSRGGEASRQVLHDPHGRPRRIRGADGRGRARPA